MSYWAVPVIPPVFLCATLAVSASIATAQAVSMETPGFGTGNQSVGVAAQYAPASGEVWGYTTNTRFTSVVLQYGVALTHGEHVRLRYTPELVPFATLLERAPSETNPAAPVRSYAAGARPVGLELDTLRGHRVQPFLSTDEGFLYYNRRVLSVRASQFMFTLDFGVGARIFASKRNAVTVSYRYQHQSNADMAPRNPGTDNHVITVGFARFSRH